MICYTMSTILVLSLFIIAKINSHQISDHVHSGIPEKKCVVENIYIALGRQTIQHGI